ncbi:DNA/RNA non-specific endonuclease [Secundilactobacillus folii]|uniref:Type VII secretion system protein EssD-like domain-containing protein n=1 Tax=Secundilactobacillus folii TaxID=2678357 RepID=A0A7X3C232_9LACO|nr:DNA/RNA non-specific endonuclease [Secundilactobacillus folii]MTV81402.1 hypothetical protein [Secundilactobacillus folii]
MPRRRRRQPVLTWLVIAIAVLVGVSTTENNERSKRSPTDQSTSQTTLQNRASAIISSFLGKGRSTENETITKTTQLARLSYHGQQVVMVNHNHPGFSEDDLSTAKGPWQQYHDLDQYNRVTGADALLGKSLMPHAQRERLYIDPTGWHNKRIRYHGESDWLYNRCHLIGYQLTGQNNNPQNLMTGTRSLNSPGMEDYETEIATYLKAHPTDYVRYRVTPVFRSQELLARGVQMQAQSVGSSEIRFNVYIFNVQPGVKIDYTSGHSTSISATQ